MTFSLSEKKMTVSILVYDMSQRFATKLMCMKYDWGTTELEVVEEALAWMTHIL